MNFYHLKLVDPVGVFVPQVGFALAVDLEDGFKW
ncbi:hypothetical protein CCACVL1_29063 [Corchorus capsularis]|uniref:Uncharacterized protein n=1 Tax=Corchorus capsularis TaxID=210143 RepID=A0A1R3G405_COCAP|nr:hypothetical protein CCACVL1_29063 [Corchorus capsularis]